MNKAKNDKFIRLAENRVNKVIEGLRLISNLSNRSNYSYSSQEVNKIFEAIDTDVKVMKIKFRENLKKDKRFKL